MSYVFHIVSKSVCSTLSQMRFEVCAAKRIVAMKHFQVWRWDMPVKIQAMVRGSSTARENVFRSVYTFDTI